MRLLGTIFTAFLALPAHATAEEPVPPVVVMASEESPPETVPETTPETTPILVILQVTPAPEASAAAPVVPEAFAYEEEEELEAEPEPFEPGLVSIGLSAIAGTRPRRDGVDATWTGGLDVGVRALSFLSVGARRIGAASSGGDRWALHLSPYVELAVRPWERVEGYAQLGAALALTIEGTDAIAVAPFVDLGVRFFVAECFSIAVEGAVHVPATAPQAFGDELFPRGAVLVQGGVALAFHFGS